MKNCKKKNTAANNFTYLNMASTVDLCFRVHCECPEIYFDTSIILLSLLILPLSKIFFRSFLAKVTQFGFSNILLFIVVVNSFWSRLIIYKLRDFFFVLHLELKYSCLQVLKRYQLCIIISFFATGCVDIRCTQAHCYWCISAVKSAMLIPRSCTDCTRRASRVGGVLAGHAGCCKCLHAVGVNGFKLRATQTENCLIKKKNWGEYWSMWRC